MLLGWLDAQRPKLPHFLRPRVALQPQMVAFECAARLGEPLAGSVLLLGDFCIIKAMLCPAASRLAGRNWSPHTWSWRV